MNCGVCSHLEVCRCFPNPEEYCYDFEPERPHGEWVDNHNGTYTCTECGEMHRDTLYLYLALEHDIINAFTDEFQGSVEEHGLDCMLQMNGICIDVENIMGGYGFTMNELWENRPNDLKFGYW